MTVTSYWGDTAAEDADAYARDLNAVLDKLLAYQRRQREQPSFEATLLSRWAVQELEEQHGQRDAWLRLMGLLLARIEELAPQQAREEGGTVVLNRILAHELPAEEISRQVRAHAERSGTPLPPEAEMKAYLARSVDTGKIAQQLLDWHSPARQRPEAGLFYTLALSAVAADDLQFHDVFEYLLAVHGRLG